MAFVYEVLFSESSPFSPKFGGFIVLGSSYGGQGLRACGTAPGPSNFLISITAGRREVVSLQVSSFDYPDYSKILYVVILTTVLMCVLHVYSVLSSSSIRHHLRN